MTRREPGVMATAAGGSELVRRAFNVVSSAAGLLVLSPVLLAVGIAIALDSKGPVFFRQVRVGRGGVPFEIVKFRSMTVDAEAKGGQLSIGADPRVTRVGRVIRAWKLDELPQLFNVLKGDMDLVGPRPEVPRYVALYTPAQREVLSVRPGITDPASVAFRDESALMGQQEDPERYYVEVIMPHKLKLNLEYLAERTLASDVRVILGTLAAVTGRRG